MIIWRDWPLTNDHPSTPSPYSPLPWSRFNLADLLEQFALVKWLLPLNKTHPLNGLVCWSRFKQFLGSIGLFLWLYFDPFRVSSRIRAWKTIYNGWNSGQSVWNTFKILYTCTIFTVFHLSPLVFPKKTDFLYQKYPKNWIFWVFGQRTQGNNVLKKSFWTDLMDIS